MDIVLKTLIAPISSAAVSITNELQASSALAVAAARLALSRVAATLLPLTGSAAGLAARQHLSVTEQDITCIIQEQDICFLIAPAAAVVCNPDPDFHG